MKKIIIALMLFVPAVCFGQKINIRIKVNVYEKATNDKPSDEELINNALEIAQQAINANKTDKELIDEHFKKEEENLARFVKIGEKLKMIGDEEMYQRYLEFIDSYRQGIEKGKREQEQWDILLRRK